MDSCPEPYRDEFCDGQGAPSGENGGRVRDELVKGAWDTFLDRRCDCHRGELIAHYWPLAQRVAGKMRRMVPSHVHADDVVSFGAIGLIRAVDNYDPTLGTTFETYAVASVRSSVLDELRALDWAPRSLRRRQREVDAARTLEDGERGGTATDEDVAHRLGWTVEEVRHTDARTAASRPRSLDEAEEVDGPGRAPSDLIEDVGAAVAPGSEVSAACDAAADALEQAPALGRAVVALYYYEGRSLADAARVLGAPEARVSEAHSQAIRLVARAVRAAMDGGRHPSDPYTT